jgi:AcrR family transcriptional regulator
VGRRNLHTRGEIRALALRNAAEIVEREGATALSAREVARRIGYTVGTVYLVFTNLDDLIVQLNEQTVVELARALEAVNQKTRAPDQRVRLLVAAYLGFALLHTNRWRLVFEHRLPTGQSAPPSYKGHTQSIFALVIDNLRHCMPRDSQASVEETAIALWSAVHGICVLAVAGKSQAGGAASVQRLLDILLDRFLGAPRRPAKRRRRSKAAPVL